MANGEAEVPLGWTKTQIILHDQVFTVRAVVLTSKALAYSVVLGLDFIFSTGLQINVADSKYSFKMAPHKEYAFQPGQASVPVVRPSQLKRRQRNKNSNQNLLLFSSFPPTQFSTVSPDIIDDPTLIAAAVSNAQLSSERKPQLLHLLRSNPKVCTHQLGRTTVLQHCLYTTHPVPVKQRG